MRFAFETWRGEEGILHTNKLTLTRQVSRDELDRFMKLIKPYEIITVRVIFTGSDTAEFLELMDQMGSTDNALVQRAAELLIPKTQVYEPFGTFTLDRRVDWYSATTMWAGRAIQLDLKATNEIDIEAALQVAISLWKDQAIWNLRIQEYAVQEFLDLKNSEWRDEVEGILTPDDFKSRMSLEAITVSPDEKFEFWHDDGDLFFGHSILIRGDLLNGPTGADIAG